MPRKKSEAPIEEPVEVSEEDGIETSEQGSIIPVNAEATFGIQLMDRKHLVLYERTLYKERTEVKARGRGQDKTFEPGEYGPWKLSARPYPSNLSHALRCVFEWIVNDNIHEANDFSFILEAVEQAKAEIMEAASKIKLS